jgi:phospholipase/carboxylesterase
MTLHETETEVVLEPASPADAAVIWLHGLGADGRDFVPIVPELGLPAAHRIRFIFPHAPVRRVTLNGHMPMRAWFDIYSLDREGPQDREGIEASRDRILARIGDLTDSGIAASRIVLAGFSQGGAIALHTALRYAPGLAGLLPLSTYLPQAATLTAETAVAPKALSVLMMHGRFDPVLPIGLGEAARDQVQQLGYAVDWRHYAMQHQVCMEQITEIGEWLVGRLPPV